MNSNTLISSNEEIQYGQYTVPPADEFVKFGVGQPSTEMLPLELIKKYGLTYVNSITDKSVLQYGDIPGYKQLLQEFAKYLSEKYNEDVKRNELFITNGVTDALHLICSLYSSKNPLVVMEDPTYFLANDIFHKDFAFDVLSVPMESDGMNMNALMTVLEENKHREILLYTIPTFHNPTSYTTSHNKRVWLGQIVDSYPNITGIADEVYQLLYFEDSNKPPSTMCNYSDKFISLGSFSKILAPSLRMGWMQIKNPKLMELFVNSAKFDSSGGNAPFVQAVIHGILMNGQLDQNIVSCRKFLFDNCTTLSDLIKSRLSNYVEFVRPNGGYFLWLKLKAPLTATALLKEAESFKVSFHSGSRFSVSGGDDYIRLSFSYYDRDGMKIGVDRLERLCEKVTRDLDNRPTIGILGYYGKLGTMVRKEIDVMTGAGTNIINAKVSNIDILKKCTGILDVSRPDGTITLLNTLIREKLTIPLVVGTTGLSKDIEEMLKTYSETAPVAYISNFSKGIPVFIDFLDNINPNTWDIKMTETHHIHKVDAPSGTAKTLVSHVKGGNIPIESIRTGEVFGTHTVNCSTLNEELSVTHTAKTRDLFAVGAVEYLGWIIKQKPGLYYNNRSEIKFSKYSACGNDFIIVMSEDFNMHPDKKVEFVKKVCRRHLDIGADGVIEVRTDTSNADVVYWTYYNSDGNTVEMCGNGARCVGRYARDHNLVNMEISNITLINNFDIMQNVYFNKECEGTICVDMPDKGSVGNDHKDIFGASSFQSTSLLTIGVPHIVHKLYDTNIKSLNDYPLSGLGEQSMKKFEANVNIYCVQDDKNIFVRTYERGVNAETLACGSGCCAVALSEWHNSSEPPTLETKEYKMHVKSKDVLTVYITYDGKISLGGPANKVFSGVVSLR